MKLPMFNSEDMHDHRTVALAARLHGLPCDRFAEDKYLFSINLKHRMITFPIGKCRPNEGLVDGLIREMQEELGVEIRAKDINNQPYCTFTKPYSFTGTPVKVETNVFCVADGYGDWLCKTATNNETAKCGGIFFATIPNAIDIARSTGLKIADCVMFYKQFRSERQF